MIDFSYLHLKLVCPLEVCPPSGRHKEFCLLCEVLAIVATVVMQVIFGKTD